MRPSTTKLANVEKGESAKGERRMGAETGRRCRERRIISKKDILKNEGLTSRRKSYPRESRKREELSQRVRDLILGQPLKESATGKK